MQTTQIETPTVGIQITHQSALHKYKDSAVEWRTSHLLHQMLAGGLVTEMECIRVPITADRIGKEPITVVLVGDSLLVLMIALEPNRLLITRQVLSKEDGLLRYLQHVFQ